MAEHNGLDHKTASPSPSRSFGDSSSPRSVGKLRVQVVGARNLVGKDRNGKSDPFIVLNLPGAPPPPPTRSSTHASDAGTSSASSSSAIASSGSRRERDYYRRLTPVKPKTLNPQWTEAEATFEWDINTDWFDDDFVQSTHIQHSSDSNDERGASLQPTTKSSSGRDSLAPHVVTAPATTARPSNVRKLSAATGKILIAPVRMTTKGAIATGKVIRRRAPRKLGRPRPMRLRRGPNNAQGQAPVGSVNLGARDHADGQGHTGVVGAIEFVAWDKDKWSGNDYLGEVSLEIGDWIAPGKTAHWKASEVMTLPLKSTRRNTKVTGEILVRVGIVPAGGDDTADEVYARLVEGNSDPHHAGIRSVPADLSVGTSGPAEAFLDDGLSSGSESEAREELLSDDGASISSDGEMDDTDDLDTDGLASTSDAEESSDNDYFALQLADRSGSVSPAIQLDGVTGEASQATRPSRRTLVGRLRQTGSYIVKGGRSGGTTSTQNTSEAPSDAGDEETRSVAQGEGDPRRRRRLRVPGGMPRRKPRKQRTDSSMSSSVDAATTAKRANRRQRRAEARRRRQDYSLKASLGMDIIGIVQIEVKGATDLPRWRNSLGTSFDMDAFVVVSFGQRVFRTRVARHSLNPTWDEKLLFHVRRHEANYLTKLAVYDWDKLSSNDFVGDCDLPVSELVEAAPKSDPITGLYPEEMDDVRHGMKSYSLPLLRTEGAGEGKHSLGKHESKLHIEARFTPYAALRQRFWRQLLRQYDTSDSGTLNTLEFTAMLDSLGSTLSVKTLDDIFAQYGKESTEGDAEKGDLELSIDQAIVALEAELLKPYSQKRVVHKAATGAGSLDEAAASGMQTPADEHPPPMRGLDYVGPAAPSARDAPSESQVPVPPTAVDGAMATGRFARTIKHDASAASLGTVASVQSGSSASMSSAAAAPGNARLSPSLAFSSMERETTEGEIDDDAAVHDEDDGSDDRVERIIVLRSCPLCRMPRLSKKAEVDIVTHLAVCASQDWRRVDSMVVGNYVTAMQAHRKWVTRIISKISQGQYQLGANSANIIVQDRLTGQLLEEKMQAYVRLGIRMLYNGARSRMEGARVKRMLKNMSIKQGRKYDSPHSAREIPHFIAFHALKVDEIREPIDSFKTFNEFFYRKLKPDARPVDDKDDPSTLVSGADCRLMVFPTVTEATKIWIKGRDFSVERLLGEGFLPRKQKSPTWAEELNPYREGGAFSIFRLAPQDYHRFHCPADCTVGPITVIDGQYYTVNPMAIRSTIDVYCENVRVVVPLLSKEFGTFYYICIGAMMVGSTVLTVKQGDELKRGDEIGFFKFGGSTICMSFAEGIVEFDDDLVTNSGKAIETLVRVGMRIGKSKQGQASKTE